jgi:hypothetical protein
MKTLVSSVETCMNLIYVLDASNPTEFGDNPNRRRLTFITVRIIMNA